MPSSSRTRHLRSLFAVNDSPTRWPIALKAALAMAIPLAIATALGHQQLGLLANMGGFTVLYGPKQPGRFRIKLLLAVAAGLITCAALGALLAPWPLLWIVMDIAMACVGVFACAALQIGAPGAFFFTLVTGSAANIAGRGVPVPCIVGSVAIGAASAILIGMSDVLLRPYGPQEQAIAAARTAVGKLDEVSARDNSDEAETLRRKAAGALHTAWTVFHDGGGGSHSRRGAQLESELIGIQAAYVAHHTRRSAVLAGMVNSRSVEALTAENRALLEDERFSVVREAHLGRPPAAYLVRTALRWPSAELWIALRTTAAAILAAVAVTVLHSGHPYWAVAFAVLMTHQGGTRVAQTIRSVQRFGGTVLGLGLFALIQLLHVHGWGVVLTIALLQFSIEELVTRNYGAAVITMTPLALTVASAGSPGLLMPAVRDRLTDTACSSLAAVAAVWLVGGTAMALNLLRGQLVRDAEAISSVLRDRARGVDSRGALARRQFLHYELINTTGVQTLARGDDPTGAKEWADVVASMRALGMQVLGMCWYPTRIGDSETYADARERLRTVIGDIRTTDPAEVSRVLDRTHRALLTAGEPGD